MNSRLPGDVPAANADGETTARIRPGRRLITVMLLAAAALDLTGAASSSRRPGTRCQPAAWPRPARPRPASPQPH